MRIQQASFCVQSVKNGRCDLFRNCIARQLLTSVVGERTRVAASVCASIVRLDKNRLGAHANQEYGNSMSPHIQLHYSTLVAPHTQEMLSLLDEADDPLALTQAPCNL